MRLTLLATISFLVLASIVTHASNKCMEETRKQMLNIKKSKIHMNPNKERLLDDLEGITAERIREFERLERFTRLIRSEIDADLGLGQVLSVLTSRFKYFVEKSGLVSGESKIWEKISIKDLVDSYQYRGEGGVLTRDNMIGAVVSIVRPESGPARVANMWRKNEKGEEITRFAKGIEVVSGVIINITRERIDFYNSASTVLTILKHDGKVEFVKVSEILKDAEGAMIYHLIGSYYQSAVEFFASPKP